MLDISTLTCHTGKEEILYVKWVDYDPFMKFNFEMYFFSIIEQITEKNITKLLLDASARKHDPSEEEFKEIMELFLSGLLATKLEKFARISSPNPVIRTKFNRILEQTAEGLNLSFQVRNFDNAKDALAWLQIKNYTLENAIKS